MRSEDNPRKGVGGVRNAVAVLAAVATLLGGGIVAPSAYADDSASSATASQSATTAASSDTAASSGSSDTKTITSVDDPALIRGTQGDTNLALPKTVTVHYSDGSTDDLAVTWSGDGFQSDADLAKMTAGTHTFKGTVAGTDKQPTATLELAQAADANKDASKDANADQQGAQNAPQADQAAPKSGESTAEAGKTIKSVETYDYGEEAVGIRPGYISYSVNVTYTDGTTGSEYVNWDTNSIDPSKPGKVTVEGTIQGSDVKAKATIEYVKVKSIEKPELYALPGQYPDTPYQVKVTLADGTELQRSVSWSYDTIWSDSKAGQDVTVKGTLQNSDDKVTTTATVHVREVASYSKVEVKTIKGIAPQLPGTVTAKLSDGKSADFSVTWDSIDASKYAAAGTFTVEGTVSGASSKAKATVTVQDYKPLESVYVTTGVGRSPRLPYQVNVTLDDGTLQQYNVGWPSIEPSQYQKAGTFEVTGHLYSNSSETSVEVKATVQVLAIREVETRTDYTVPGKPVTLPSSVEVTYSDGTTDYRDVTWESVDPSLYDKEGEFTVKGTVEYTDIFAVETVRVVPITKVNGDSSLTTLVGVKQSLPSSTSVTFADGRTDFWTVKWDAVDDAKWNTVGTFDVTGKVNDTDLTTVAHVTVAGLKTTEYSQKTYVGGSFSTPSLELTNGSSIGAWNVSVEWDKDPYDSSLYTKPGEYDFKGSIKGTKLSFTVHVSVLAVKSVANPTPVTTVTGVAPSLPGYATFTLTDGSKDSSRISWKSIDPSQYAQAGTFTVDGTVDSIGKGVTVTVTVLDSQKTQEVTVSTLREFAPTLPYSVKTTLWNGTTRDVTAQWENPDPKSYASVGSFDVKGYLLGSEIPIVAHVNVYDAADPVVQTVNTTVGVAPQDLPTGGVSVKLTNGDTFQTPWDSTITWAKIDPSQYAKAGSFDVEGSFFAKDIKVYARVNVGEVYGWTGWANPYKTTYVIGESTDNLLPETMQAITADGVYTSLPVKWNSYDKKLLKQDGATITVTGKSTGAKALDAKAIISVVAVKSVNKVDDITVTAGTMPKLPYGVTGKLSNGDDRYLSATWDPIKPEQYAKAGSFTVNGKAGVSSDNKTFPVSVKVNVVDDIASADPVDAWTIPGVAPSLPSTVSVDYPKSVTARIGEFFKSVGRAVSGDSASENKPTLAVTWDDIDPSKYAKDGSTFTVEGTIAGSKVKAKATIKVSGIKTVQLPAITTVAQRYPSLPYQIAVITNDGATHQISANWDSIPASAYQEAGSLFTVSGKGYLGSYSSDGYTLPLSTSVYVRKVTKVITSSMDGLVTEVGTTPILFANLPVETSTGQVVNAPVTWDNIKPASYAKTGEFTVTGHMASIDAGVSTASLMTARSLDARATNDGGTVKVKVKVIAKQDKPQVSLIDYTTNTITPGEDFTLPETVTAYMSDGSTRGYSNYDGTNDGLKVTWDTKGVDFNKPGSYDIVGKVQGTSKQAHYYLTVADVAGGTLTSFEPVTKQFAAGTTAKDAAAALPQQVTANYSDGTSRLADVAWDLTPVTDEALKKVGTINITGNVDGTTIQAKATINVVAPAEVPQQPDDVKVSTPEGVKPTLPKSITLKYKNGATEDSPVTWSEFGDNLWADGKAGTTFKVTGVTKVGGFTVTANVTVTKVRKYTFTFDANGGKLAEGTASEVVVREGDKLAEPSNPTREGYTFAGWYDAAKGGKKVTLPFTPKGDEYAKTFYAHWTTKPVPATGVTISGTGVKDGKATVAKGKTLTVKATVTPANATDSSVTWTSDNDKIASVTPNADGTATIKGVKGGKATITVSTKPLASVTGDTAKTATLVVTVPATVSSIAAKAGKTAYTKGDKFDAKTLTVTATKDDGSVATLDPSEYTLSDTKLDTVGKKTVTVTYKADESIKTTFTLSVAERYWKVTFDSNGGSAVAETQVADNGKDHVAKPADPTREGFAFTGWTTDKAGKNAYTFDAPVTGDLTLYAQWKDSAKPVISGASDVLVKQKNAFDPLAGVTATDNVDGKVKVTVSGDDVDTSAKIGTEFTLTYTATDKAGNTATVTRKVTIVENTVDVDADKTAITGKDVKDGKATVTKNESIDLKASVAPADATHVSVEWSSSDTKVASVTPDEKDGLAASVKALRGGKATVTLKVYQTNPVGLKPGERKLVATKTVEVAVPKTAESVKPLADVTVLAGREPSLPKAATVVYDDASEESGKTIEWAESDVDWTKTKAGESYVLEGKVEGSLKVTVKVTVVTDSTAPVFSGIDDRTITAGTAFDPLAGVSATDDFDGDVTASIKVKGEVNTGKPGSYKLTYSVSDSSGNSTQAVRTITVVAAPATPTQPTTPKQPAQPTQPKKQSLVKRLSKTGVDYGAAALAVVVLIGLGAGLKLAERRAAARRRR